ncbi:hypothetical protein HZY97_19555 [Sphingomonas sp. R-74633]|uniref:hypothetical protein n=1 Tax=Sphingomonas sp. R-74633 TaxID=2751188 RepID=UPI0015D0DD41|nr:hypothetical protein [Sphingomonas sp. R-74633]NYT42980.1 hypothetical protein [Sphingomonas sp. R-74633]
MHDLPFQTITQFAGLGLTLIAGWFLGLASHSGGRKWRERYFEEDMENAGYRDRAESDLREAGRRIRDLEAENAKLKAGAPVAAPAESEGHSTATVAAAAVAGAVAGAVVTHAVEEHHAEPAHAEPAHVEPAPAAVAHTEPAPAEVAHAEPAHAEVAHVEPVHAEPAHPEHSH